MVGESSAGCRGDDAELLSLYRHARQATPDAFGEHLFTWLAGRFDCDAIAVITSFPDRPAYQDARFHGYPDIAEVLASWGAVQHLDPLSPLVLARPGRARHQDVDDPAIAAPRFDALRAHLERFSIRYTVAIAQVVPGDDAMTVFLFTRRRDPRRFDDDALSLAERLTPHAAEALATSRALALLHHPHTGTADLAVALADAQGWLVQSTPRFRQRFWANGETPTTTQLPATCLERLRRGESWPLDGGGVLHGTADGIGWLLRVRAASPLDRLTPRERAVAEAYARGSRRKDIGRELGVSPSTVKNHLSSAFAKLDVGSRAELTALVRSTDGA